MDARTYAGALAEHGGFAHAAAVLQQHVAISPEDGWALEELAQCLNEIEDYVGAYEYACRCVQLLPNVSSSFACSMM